MKKSDKYKIGDQVKVKKDTYGHGYEGEIVTIQEPRDAEAFSYEGLWVPWKDIEDINTELNYEIY